MHARPPVVRLIFAPPCVVRLNICCEKKKKKSFSFLSFLSFLSLCVYVSYAFCCTRAFFCVVRPLADVLWLLAFLSWIGTRACGWWCKALRLVGPFAHCYSVFFLLCLCLYPDSNNAFWSSKFSVILQRFFTGSLTVFQRESKNPSRHFFIEILFKYKEWPLAAVFDCCSDHLFPRFFTYYLVIGVAVE